MAAGSQERSFWTTLPGILTGVAALVTALTGLFLGLVQHDLFGPGSNRSEAPSTDAAGISSSEASGGGTPASGAASGAGAQATESTVVITARDGTVTTVYADGFRHRQTARELHLESGQIIAFDRIRSIDVTRVAQDQARVTVTLTDGRTVDGSVAAGLHPFGFSGQNDLGRFEISISNLAQITFQR